MNDAPVDCANCGARLTDQYCGRCGQDSHASLSFGHFLHEFFEGLFHVDSKFWRTLRALLTRPGLLTQEYLEGKRLRYSPPFRSYLVISIAYFVLASLFAAPSTWVVGPRGQGMRVEECAQMAAQPGWILRFVPELEERCVRLLRDDQRVLGTALQSLLPKVMFVVLPLVALVQFWIFRRQRPLYLENLVFVLHFQSFYYVASTFALMLAAAVTALAGARGWFRESLEFVVYAWSVVCEHTEDSARPGRGGGVIHDLLGARRISRRPVCVPTRLRPSKPRTRWRGRSSLAASSPFRSRLARETSSWRSC
jgi:hypothetical protein